MQFDAPDSIKNIRDIQVIYSENELQESKFDLDIQEIEKNTNITTMTENMCSKFEEYLSISTQNDDSLEVRRFRIQTVINERAPYTLEVFTNRIKTVAGENSVIITENNGTVTIKIALDKKKAYDYIRKLAEEIVPLDQILEILIMYNTWLNVYKNTWIDLLNYTWDEVMEKESD